MASPASVFTTGPTGLFDLAAFTEACARAPAAETAEGDTQHGVRVTLRGRAERCRGRGKLAFIHLRQPPLQSVQVVCVGKALASQARTVTAESVIEVTGLLQRAEQPVVSTSCSSYEVHAEEIRVLSAAASPLPFPLHDVNTKLDTRLNHRAIDLRTPLSVSLLKLTSCIGQAFRSRLNALHFTEIHTPKLIAAASEGGSAVFTVDYFGRAAYLAQSPQLFKQMAIMGDGMGVFEIGPVFRAEKSLTHRHLTEFVGLDAEFVVQNSHHEVLNVLEYVMGGVLTELHQRHRTLLQTAQDALLLQQQQQQQCQQLREAEASCPESAVDQTENQSSSDAASIEKFSPAEDTASCSAAIRWEVSEEVVARYGIGNDTLHSEATADRYGARIGGGTLRVFAADADGDASSSPSSPLSHTIPCPRVLRLGFDNAVQLLRDDGDVDAGADGDFSLPQERRLGQLVAQRYEVDMYAVDGFPSATRPFYTMPLSEARADRSRSFDLYLRGEEICSGAQRQHDVDCLERQLRASGVDPAAVRDYVDSFRYGAWPHGGFGLGLERIALFLLNASDIRQVSAFPRDPKRLTP